MITHPFVVRTSSEHMPRSCWGTYRRIAVIKTRDGKIPPMISERARGVIRIVCGWRRLNVGGERSAYHRALRDAQWLARALNSADWGCPV
jgi:hypothetical protein